MPQASGGSTDRLQATVRQAVANDAVDIGIVGYASWSQGIGALLSPEPRQRVHEHTFRSFAATSFPEILVADVTGRIVGLTATEDGNNTISDLWVAPDHEGCGVGSALLAAVERRIAQRGFAVAEIEVLTMNRRALGLYLYRGYRALWRGLCRDRHLCIDIHRTRLRKTLAGSL